MPELNYLGMPVVEEPIWDEVFSALGDPAKVAAEGKAISSSRWDEIMTDEHPAIKKEKPRGEQPQSRSGGARRSAAERGVQPRANAGAQGRKAGGQPAVGARRPTRGQH